MRDCTEATENVAKTNFALFRSRVNKNSFLHIFLPLPMHCIAYQWNQTINLNQLIAKTFKNLHTTLVSKTSRHCPVHCLGCKMCTHLHVFFMLPPVWGWQGCCCSALPVDHVEPVEPVEFEQLERIIRETTGWLMQGKLPLSTHLVHLVCTLVHWCTQFEAIVHLVWTLVHLVWSDIVQALCLPPPAVR